MYSNFSLGSSRYKLRKTPNHQVETPTKGNLILDIYQYCAPQSRLICNNTECALKPVAYNITEASPMQM